MIIISQPWGGLGDNLQLSTLPEVAYNLGIDVYVSNHNTYKNPEIKKLVWDTNPYIKGYTDEPGNTIFSGTPSGNVISHWEQLTFGKVFNNRPKLYYTPKKITELHSRIVVDSNAHAVNSGEAVSTISIKHPDALYLNCAAPSTGDSITSSDIFEWVDMITSAKEFVCQHSGGSVVAAAYNKPCTVYRTTQDQLYMFDLHTYIQV
jgi:hypothetical protein